MGKISPLRVVTETASLRDRTTEALRNAILSLHLAPGEKLVERRLCDETGVSRTCIREALRHLEAEGLVTRTPNRGMFVAKLTSDDARQIYEVRAILESAMVRNFVERATRRDVVALQKSLSKVTSAAKSGDAVAYARALVDLTDVILNGADNDLAKQILDTLRARMTYLRVITAKAASEEVRNGTIKALTDLVEAIVDGNADLAEQRSKAYVKRSANFAMEVFKARDQEEARELLLRR